MPTAPEPARRAHAIFTAAMELEARERVQFARAQCGDDGALFERVGALLRAAERSSEFLESPAVRAPAREPAIPDAVGSYLVVGVLGVGGMATVYEAIQEQPRRRVALKVLHRAMHGTDAYQRFLFETEALARLRHPGIAQIYEAGATALGQPEPSPFYAMELVPGAVHLTRYVEQRAMPLRERVRLFTLVCDAVHHGHQQGIVHRDIKPANVLVDKSGAVKVIDFGVARDVEGGASLTAAADAGQLIGTLNYMSPEQCTPGAGVDTRTDVYALGVLLYELCCGGLPHDLAGLPLPAAVSAITQDPPRRPRLPSSPAERDLEAIILRCIEKSPERRYDGAGALLADLRRWLDSRPTEARPPGALDQVRYFARRNPAIVAASATAAAAVLLVAVVSTLFALRLSREVESRREAERQTASERDLARWQAYTAGIAGALSAMKSNEFLQMRTRLAGASHPKRGWEWGFLNNLADRSVSVVRAHDDMILDMAVDAGWTRIATAAADGSVRLWRPLGSEPVASFQSGTGARVFAVAFTRDGASVVTGDDRGVVRLLDGADLREIEVIAELPSAVRSIAPLADGRIALGGYDGRAFILSLGSGGETPLPGDQPGGVHGVVTSPDGSSVATFNDDGSIWVRRGDDLSVVQRLEFPGPVNQVRFSAAGSKIAAAGGSRHVYVWDVESGAIVRQFDVTRGVNTVRSLAFAGNGDLLLAGLVHRGFVACSISEGRIVSELGGHTDAVSGLAFSPDDSLLVSTSWDRTIRIWHAADFEALTGGAALAGHTDFVLDVVFSPDGSAVASASADGSVRLWDPDLALPVARLHAGSSIRQLAFSPDGSRIGGACADGLVRIWDARSGALVSELAGHTRAASSIAFSPDGALVASGGQDATVRVWRLETGEQVLMMEGHSARVNSVRFSPDGAVIASGSRDKTVRVWDASSGELRWSAADHESDVFAVLFNSKGDRLYSGCRDQTVRVWSAVDGAPIATLGGHGQYVTSLALNPDETRLAAGSWFGEVVLFDVDTHDIIASFRAHDSAVRGVAFSPDGRWLATASFDSTVRLFDSAARSESDEARRTASANLESSRRAAAAALAGAGAEPHAVADALARAGLDPAADPWVRKAVLTALAPP